MAVSDPGYGTGYDMDRFVNLSENEKCELTCSICHEILNNPLVTNCCLQTFCKVCITDWIRDNTNCPYDRKYMDINALREPPRLLKNLLGKLEITCDYKEKGCPEILRLEALTQHKAICAFNVQTCDICSCVMRRGCLHNCVTDVLALKEKISDENEILKAEKESLNQNIVEISHRFNQEIDSLKEENESLKKTNEEINEELLKTKAENEDLVQKYKEFEEKMKKEIIVLKDEKNILKLSQKCDNYGLNASSGSLQRSTSSQALSNRHSIEEVLNESRKYLRRPEILECNASQEIADKIVDFISKELRFNDNLFNICKNIVYKCDHELGSSWYCLGNYTKGAQNYIHSSCYIKVKFGSLLFKVFRSKFLDLAIIRRRLRSGKIRPEIKVFENNMNSDLVSFVEKISLNALQRFDSLKEIVSEIQCSMKARYPGNWQCFGYSFGDHCIQQYKREMYINFEIAELRVTLFQTK